MVPCPHCSNGLPPGKIPLLRSSSLNPDLRPPSNPAVIKVCASIMCYWCYHAIALQDYPYNARAPTLANVTNTSSQTGNSRRLFWPLGGRRVTEEEVSQEHLTSPDVTFYAFQYDECVIRARDVLSVKCPSHEELPLEFIAPDTVSPRLNILGITINIYLLILVVYCYLCLLFTTMSCFNTFCSYFCLKVKIFYWDLMS